MKHILLAVLICTLVFTPALAFTPTQYHYTNNSITPSWNQASGFVNNAVTLVKQDVTQAKEFVRETVTRTRNLISYGQQQVEVVQTHGLPQVQQEATQLQAEATAELERAREDWYENKDSYFSQVKDRVKQVMDENGQRIKQRVQRYIPRVRDVITTLDFEVMKILRRGGH